jgi:predicted nucleic acid-binding protein
MAWLLDTNVISELRRPRPDPYVVQFLREQVSSELFLCTVTLAEIRFGIERVTDPEVRAEIQDWLDNDVRVNYAEPILGLTEDVILSWRVLLERGRKSGRNYSQPDLFFAAIALEYDLTLVTRNVKDFIVLDVPIINPWDEPV